MVRKSVFSVTEDTPVKEASRLIFSMDITGIPVIRGTKLVGIVTEKDILAKIFPSLQDVAEDFIHSYDFEAMEENLINVLSMPVKKIMNTNVVSISFDAPIMRAQSAMLVNKISRLPVVDKENNLLGIVSQGNIFRHLLKKEMPKMQKERYADYIAGYYDDMVSWENRFKHDFPILKKLAKQLKAKNILDIGTWTGEYAIELAKKVDASITGVDHNPRMIEKSNQKKEKLTAAIKNKISFFFTDFENMSADVNKKFEIALCLGNSLPYVPISIAKLVKDVSNKLLEKNGIFIIQLHNFEKILKKHNKLLNFTTHKSDDNDNTDHLFIEFLDKKNKKQLIHNVVIFGFDGDNWVLKANLSLPIHHIQEKEIEELLKKSGFKNIQITGNKGPCAMLSVKEPFNPQESDWLNIIARK